MFPIKTSAKYFHVKSSQCDKRAWYLDLDLQVRLTLHTVKP